MIAADIEWVWVPDRDWRVPSQYTRCRTSNTYPCWNSPVADLQRTDWKKRPRWYAYCEQHMYGRRLRDGVVEVRVHPNSPAAKRGHV